MDSQQLAELRNRLRIVTERMVRERQLAAENLTEQQMADAIQQAVLAGDFKILVRAGDGAQAVVYLPYSGIEELRSRVRHLEEMVRELGGDPFKREEEE